MVKRHDMKLYEFPFSGPALLHAYRQLAEEATSMRGLQVFESA